MPVKICYIDTETTGLDAKRCGIIQIAAIMEIDGIEVDTFEMKMRPADGLEINDEALAISGTTREELSGYQSELDAYLAFVAWIRKYVERFAKNDKAFFAGYNSPFDVEFVRAWFTRNYDKFYGSLFWSGSIDVMGAALWALREERHAFPNFKLGTVALHVLGEDRIEELTCESGLHDALCDIRITKALHKEITK